MKYYSEKFGFDITENNEPKIFCVCENIFTISRKDYITGYHLFNCPKCKELWRIEEGFIGKGTISLIRPKTNSQIHLEHPKKIRL